MIQELLRGGGGGGGSAGVVLGGATERKFSINCGVFEGSVSSTTNTTTTTTHFNSSSTTHPPPPPQTTTTTTTSNPNPNFPTSAAVASDQQNLRCPRCDSSNTKFCYYNNYNLTQPRHFCKTCRRYWTKGGALRNVPIGGGCRKNKSSIVSTTTTVKSSAGKVKTGSPDIVKSALGFGFDHDHPPSSITNPILWPPPPQNSHLLALLRATSQNPNPNPLKEEGNMIGSHHHMISSSDHHSTAVSGALNARSLSLDPMSTSHVPMSLCSSFWRNNQNQNQNHQQQQQQQHQQQQQQQQQQQNHHQQQSFLVGHEVQNSGIQELYQRLRSSTNYYSDIHSPVVPTNNVVSTAAAATSTSILEPSSVAGAAELGYWNPSFSWSNLSTTNGAFP